jgi:hypothetical protein
MKTNSSARKHTTRTRIIAMNRELKEQAARSESALAGTISSLCQVLEQSCLFWFEVRQEDIVANSKGERPWN